MPKNKTHFNFQNYLKTLNEHGPNPVGKNRKVPSTKKSIPRPKAIRPVEKVLSQMPPIVNIPNTRMHVLRSVPVTDMIKFLKERKIKKLFTVVKFSPEDHQRLVQNGVLVFPLVKTKVTSGSQKVAGFEEFFQTIKSETGHIAVQCFGGRHTSRQFVAYAMLRQRIGEQEVVSKLRQSGTSAQDLNIIVEGVKTYLKKRQNELKSKNHHHSNR